MRGSEYSAVPLSLSVYSFDQDVMQSAHARTLSFPGTCITALSEGHGGSRGASWGEAAHTWRGEGHAFLEEGR